jgi:hypothetical protein
LVDLTLQNADAGKRPIALVIVEPESNDKAIWDLEAPVFDGNIHEPARGFVQESADDEAVGLPA